MNTESRVKRRSPPPAPRKQPFVRRGVDPHSRVARKLNFNKSTTEECSFRSCPNSTDREHRYCYECACIFEAIRPNGMAGNRKSVCMEDDCENRCNLAYRFCQRCAFQKGFKKKRCYKKRGVKKERRYESSPFFQPPVFGQQRIHNEQPQQFVLTGYYLNGAFPMGPSLWSYQVVPKGSDQNRYPFV